MPIAVSEFERLAGDVLGIYEEAEQQLLKRMSKHLVRGIASDSWTQRKYSEMTSVTSELRKTVGGLKSKRTAMTAEFINKAYKHSSDAFVSEAQAFTDVLGITHLPPNAQKAASIILDLNGLLDAADRRILRKASDAYADIVGRASALAATGSITVREAVKRELNEFANRGITSFVDKSGKMWDMATYAEMATLTAIERATIDGYIDTMQSFGFDLAVISSHIGACPVCAAWHDVVVSISGTDPHYPPLSDAQASGVFHPRCMHHLSTYYEGITHNVRNAPRPVQEPTSYFSIRQKQRALERKVRQWKRRMAVATDPYDEREAYARVRLYQKRIRELISEHDGSIDLPRKYWREGGATKLTPEAKKLKPVRLTQ